MEIVSFLQEITLIIGLAVVATFVCYKYGVPSIVGFLITGVLAGPLGFNLIGNVENIEFFSQIGIVFLVFSVGMQFSFSTLFKLRRVVLIGGSIQVLLTIAAVAVLLWIFGLPLLVAVLFGMLICHSSTTIILRMYQERGEVVSPQGENTLAISLFQDIMSIPMLLILPILAGHTGNVVLEIVLLFGKVAGIILLALFISRYVVGGIINQISMTRSSELFLMGILVICLFITVVSSRLGLSLALGAFLAGLVISESEYIYQAFATVLPLRDIFSSFFFVSIGMLLNIQLLIERPLLILVLALGVVSLKMVIAGLAGLCVGLSLRTSLLVGLALSNIGEFGFILASAAQVFGFFPGETYGIFLAVTVFTMAVNPFVIHNAPRISDRLIQLPLPERFRPGLYRTEAFRNDTSMTFQPRNHLIIAGFGYAGKNVASAARAAGIPYVVVDINPVTVRDEREKGLPIFYGDASQQTVLEHAGIISAKALMISVPHIDMTAVITAMARSLNPSLFIIARSRFITEIDRLRVAGADEVIPDEYQTTVEFIHRVVSQFNISHDSIEQLIDNVREGV